MTLYQFNMLDEMEQIEAIWNEAIELVAREDREYRYTLYQIDAFYVEELWHKEKDIRFTFRSFSSANSVLLKPYLELIDISRL
jgi:hypothetical protein